MGKVNLRKDIFILIFGTETRSGRNFDIVLLWMIILSVTVVILESVAPIRDAYHDVFVSTEWFFTFIFSLEYLLRIYSSPRPLKYITSFYGVVDLSLIHI